MEEESKRPQNWESISKLDFIEPNYANIHAQKRVHSARARPSLGVLSRKDVEWDNKLGNGDGDNGKDQVTTMPAAEPALLIPHLEACRDRIQLGAQYHGDSVEHALECNARVRQLVHGHGSKSVWSVHGHSGCW